jgi:hypothetical protein
MNTNELIRNHPEYDKALVWAAANYLSFIDASLAGKEILAELRQDKKLDRKKVRLWKVLENRAIVADLIESLASQFIRFQSGYEQF